MHEPRRPWQNPPDFALESIAIRLAGPLTFSSFASVCRSWRSISKSCKRHFLASQPPLLISLPSLYTPTDVAYIVSEKRNHILTNRALPAALSDIACLLGHSHGHLIGFSYLTRQVVPTLIHILTGSKTSFPGIIAQTWWLGAVLTSPPTSTDCFLIMHKRKSIHYCPVNGSEWKSRVFPCCILNVDVDGDKLYIRFSSNDIDVMDIAGGRMQWIRVITRPMNCVMELPMFVESDGELLLMRHKDGEFEGYRLDLSDGGESGWVRMEGLGGRSVFCDGGGRYGKRGYGGGGMKGVEKNCLYELWGANGFYVSGMRIRCVDGGKDKYLVGTFRFDVGHEKMWLHPRDFEQWGLI